MRNSALLSCIVQRTNTHEMKWIYVRKQYLLLLLIMYNCDPKLFYIYTNIHVVTSNMCLKMFEPYKYCCVP